MTLLGDSEASELETKDEHNAIEPDGETPSRAGYRCATGCFFGRGSGRGLSARLDEAYHWLSGRAMFMLKTVGRCGTILVSVLAMAGFAAARPQAAEKQTETPAEAARKTREQKKTETKATHVWDNDNISVPTGGVEVVGPDPNAPAPDANAAADQTVAGAAAQLAPGAGSLSPDELAHLQAAIKEAQEKIEELKRDINLTQRAYDLDASMFYGKPDFREDKDGVKAINREKAALDDKKQQLLLAQQILAQLWAKLGGPPPKAPDTKPAQPQVPPGPPGSIPLGGKPGGVLQP